LPRGRNEGKINPVGPRIERAAIDVHKRRCNMNNERHDRRR
jgi:hypothetical protein